MRIFAPHEKAACCGLCAVISRAAKPGRCFAAAGGMRAKNRNTSTTRKPRAFASRSNYAPYLLEMLRINRVISVVFFG
jgi:hypothetical protein